ncbi:MAG: saccharopine dehydrogenase, partial [Sphingobacteriia bacterium]|nr:saccharopine dehydrogenase [Sphingobacteriia bacterium]
MPFRPILVLGAGRSSGYLIRYLAQHSTELECTLTVADQDLGHAQAKIAGLPNCQAVALDPLTQPEILDALVQESKVVISLLPVSLHMQVATCCLKNKVSLFTASYQSVEMETLEPDIQANGLLFLNECGCDPGLDHMTALQIMDRLRDAGHSILSYEGY